MESDERNFRDHDRLKESRADVGSVRRRDCPGSVLPRVLTQALTVLLVRHEVARAEGDSGRLCGAASSPLSATLLTSWSRAARDRDASLEGAPRALRRHVP